MVSYALCEIADGCIRDGQIDHALATAKEIRQLMIEIVSLVGAPTTLSTSAAREVAELIADLEARTQAVEAALETHNRNAAGSDALFRFPR